MKRASAGLIAFLNSLGPNQGCVVADLLTIILQDGTVVRLTSASQSIDSTSMAISFTDASVYTFIASTTSFQRGDTKTVIGFDVDSMSLTIMTDPATDTLEGLSWPAAASAGVLDYAKIVLERVYMPMWGDASRGTLIVFAGYAGDVSASRTAVQISVESLMTILTQQSPRNCYQGLCSHVLYDAGCTLSEAAFTHAGTIDGLSTTDSLDTDITTFAFGGFFAQGIVTFTSGANAGLKRNIQSNPSLGVFVVTPPFPFVPAFGDSLTASFGCDKTLNTCVVRFNNLAHFNGQEYIPVPELAS